MKGVLVRGSLYIDLRPPNTIILLLPPLPIFPCPLLSPPFRVEGGGNNSGGVGSRARDGEEAALCVWGETANESIYQLPPFLPSLFLSSLRRCDVIFLIPSLDPALHLPGSLWSIRILSSVLKVFPLDVGVLGRRGGDDGDGRGRGRRRVLSTLGRGPKAAEAAAVAVVVPAVALVLGSGFLYKKRKYLVDKMPKLFSKKKITSVSTSSDRLAPSSLSFSSSLCWTSSSALLSTSGDAFSLSAAATGDTGADSSTESGRGGCCCCCCCCCSASDERKLEEFRRCLA